MKTYHESQALGDGSPQDAFRADHSGIKGVCHVRLVEIAGSVARFSVESDQDQTLENESWSGNVDQAALKWGKTEEAIA